MGDKYTIEDGSAPVLDGSTPNIEVSSRQYPLLFEILRSFTTLAETLNLSHAVRELGSTRQTLRRHISQLEEIKGGALFNVADRQYELTDLGRKVLPEAEDLLTQADAWVNGNSQMINGMQHLKIVGDDGWCYYQQQHPIGGVFRSSNDMLGTCLQAWADAGGEIEHDAMQAVRPKCMTFRRSDGNWVFTEVGEESSFMSWFGWKIARSTIGRPLGQLPGGSRFDRLVNAAYLEVEQTQSLRLDHCFTVLQNTEIGGPVPICYERLLLGSRFADGSFAVVSALRRTYDVEIRGVTDDMLRQMPEKFLM
ncbi:LysR family transcriptional regulator [Aliishimia ponticola]|uniref:LysR family transcriptional regulator n=1 Tax=Aliishimia ponticola TaxID=2499833 RepID=A0A4S4NG51_9RHOB|nr:LysR family transcriptional regulator [Aliishimia ponticola]THH35040.1 LysR family transcriptional regulator [Aliishimia ponticola]